MDEQMFCFQCEQAAGCTACTGAAGVCGKSAETAAAQDRLTGALIAFAGQLIAAGRGPAPEQARLLMQGLFTTITNVNFDPAAVDALTRRVHDASPGTGPDYDMQALWREPDADRRSLKCFVLFSLRGMAAYNYHARVLGRIDPELDRFFCTALQAVGDPGQTTDALWQLVQATGEASYRCMELLDAANTGAFGDPEPVQVPLTIEKGPFIVISGHDLYDAQQLLEQTAKAAEAANKAKSTFLFNMSHDIRTPMNAILGYAELARNHLQEPEKIGEYMDKIHISGEKMLSIINNILQFSQIENNQIHIEETSIQTEKSFDSCIVMVQTALEEKQQHFHVTKDISYPYIYIDTTYMSEIVLNILSNAIKYTAKGGTISCALRQEPGETDGWCITEIAITDTGIGISKEFQSHIFESFSRERSSTVSGIEGTGLGMGIVKNLVDLMHGTIEVKSKLGEGSTFTVRIPCRISSREETEPTAFDETAAQTLSGCRILLAEDNDLNAEISIELLTREGLLVERANDGVACLEMLQKAPEDYYDLILMDIQMPIMDGYKATRAIRRFSDKKKAGIPIVAMTANAFTEDKERALESGMNDHVAKPIDMKVLMSVLEEQICGHKGL